MNGAYLHLLVNHFPVVLSVVGTAILLLALLTRRRDLWRYATLTLAFAGVAAIVAMLTGDAAADVMRKSWFVTRATIHAHEEAGDLAMWVAIVMGLAAAYALWRSARRGVSATGVRIDSLEAPGWLRALVLLLALAGTGAMARAAFLGGKIVHEAPALQHAPAGWVAPAEPARGGDEG